MKTFEFIQQNFARHVLPELTDDPVRDTIKAMTMNHTVKSKAGKLSPSRLTGWAIVGPNGTTLQANVQSNSPNLNAGDTRTRYEAWADALSDFQGPVCLVQFTKATLNVSNVFLTHDLRAVRVCSPDGVETFDPCLSA